MKVAQIYRIVNNMANDILGKPTYLGSDGNVYPSNTGLPEDVTVGDPSWMLKEDLTNIVDVGKKLMDTSANGDDLSQLLGAIVNHIGRVIFVDRTYQAVVPSVYRDGWEYGSIMEKIDADMPDSISNPKWDLQDGQRYEQDIYRNPKGVRMKLFNKAVTFQIERSVTSEQLKQSFSNATQLNAFLSMIETKLKNKLTIDYANLVRATINSFISATIYKEFNADLSGTTYDFGTNSKVKAVNLLGMYWEKGYDADHTLSPETCIEDLDFIKFATYQMMLYSDRMADMSVLFNIGGKERFTPKDLQHIVLLSEFEKAAAVYLQSDTFHNDLTRLPKAETVNFWQGTGDDYKFSSTSRVHTVANVTADGETYEPVETDVFGVLGIIFDHDALGVNNERNKVTAHYNANGDFYNYFYKSFARYFNDHDENFVVFFVAGE